MGVSGAVEKANIREFVQESSHEIARRGSSRVAKQGGDAA
jgi:hypothetical protein